jgi:hypothetical protein
MSRWPLWEVAGACVLALLMAGATLYMPWNLNFVVFRAEQCSRNRDLQGELYWLRKAHNLAPGDEVISRFLDSLEERRGSETDH